MEKLFPYVLCSILMILGITSSIKSSKNEGTLEESLNRMLYYTSIFLAFIILSKNLGEFIFVIESVKSKVYAINGIEQDVFKIFCLVVTYLLIHFFIYSILKIVFSLLLKSNIKRKKVSTIILSSIFGIVKSFMIILIMLMALGTYNVTVGMENPIKLFDNFSIYNQLKAGVSSSKINLIENKEQFFKNSTLPTSNVLVYYNGITLEAGIKSNAEIDKKAIALTNTCKSDREKAKTLYKWIGSNIEYDYLKAEKALAGERIESSGAVDAWITREGICFDYSCLYVAMSKAIGLKVRLITGSGFDGRQYGPHAWNEVYLEDEKCWIPVDTTFYLSGDYFDNKDFYQDHIKEDIAGEW